MWDHGTIPIYMGWTTFILIPNVNKNNQGIGLLEFLYKVMGAIIDKMINNAVIFHDALHGFREWRGTRTAITELKISQELVSMYQDSLFLVFLDLRKAYDNLDHSRILKTLEGYRSGTKLRGIMAEQWARQDAVTRKNG